MTTTSQQPVALPDIGVTVRPATLADIPFIDALQKLHTKQVGWMPTATFEGKIKLGHVLVAEETVGATPASPAEGRSTSAGEAGLAPTKMPVGYLIGNDQYFKRDDVGIIYQLNVLPGKQRGLIGATLLKAQFERSAYGCRLYCCWCAQDIAANKFWEAMGFVPLAFRTGSEKKSRTHIFWQKRIRAGDMTTPWWFPSQTTGGSIREDRLVLPIPPGTHWSDAKPLILPGTSMPGEAKQIEDQTPRPKRVKATPPAAAPVKGRAMGGLRMFAAVPESMEVEKPKREPTPLRVKQKNDPRLVAAARELRDRWLDEVNGGRAGSPVLVGCEKYDVSRLLGDRMAIEATPLKLLAA